MRLGLSLAVLGLQCALLVGAAAKAPLRRPVEWKGLEARKATVSEIVFHVQTVFDLSKPVDNNWLGRTANRFHIPTRELVVRRALLFKEGDRVIARDIYQTERLLRALDFIKDAKILPEAKGDGTVRAHVWVRDAWTIEVKMSFEQVGGQRSMDIGVQDQNFLGTGKTIGFSVSKDRERTDSQILYRDPQFLGTRWNLGADYRALSDGSARKFILERPFFALTTPWSATIGGESRKSKLMIYDESKAIFETPYWANSVRMGGAWAIHQRDDRVWRAGVALNVDDRRYGSWTVLDPLTKEIPPLLDDRRQRGPAMTLSYRQEAFESFQDIQGMDVPEDYNLALEGDLEIGTYTRRLGSTRPGSYAQLHLTDAWSNSTDRLTLFQGTVRVRPGRSDKENLMVKGNVSTYFQANPTYQVAAYFGGSYLHRPDPENLEYVGGLQGLRGYPNAIHPGDAHWVVSVEHRLFTEQRWWGLFRVGYVAFIDAGAVHRLDGKGWSPIYPDFGFGLRLGDLKSSLARVILITVTVPVARQPGQSKWQFGIGNTIQF
ncbi:MAG: BamA/TamA family outer membrane protein [Holophaga sp.]|nr:BamA/TamA family outer membrane protein [Holophaga sp.]